MTPRAVPVASARAQPSAQGRAQAAFASSCFLNCARWAAEHAPSTRASTGLEETARPEAAPPIACKSVSHFPRTRERSRERRQPYSTADELVTRRDTTTGDVRTYTYDVRGNLTRVAIGASTIVDYVIDDENRRVGKKVNGTLVKQWLYHDKLRIAAELNGSGTLASWFVYTSGNHSYWPPGCKEMSLQPEMRSRILEAWEFLTTDLLELGAPARIVYRIRIRNLIELSLIVGMWSVVLFRCGAASATIAATALVFGIPIKVLSRAARQFVLMPALSLAFAIPAAALSHGDDVNHVLAFFCALSGGTSGRAQLQTFFVTRTIFGG